MTRTLQQERERARGLATRIVAGAIMVLAATLLVFAFFLTLYGGVGYLFLSILLGVAGLALGLVGFFFQLVPMRLDELASQKREYDARERDDPRLTK